LFYFFENVSQLTEKQFNAVLKNKCRLSVSCTFLRFSCTWIGRSLMYSHNKIKRSLLCVAKYRGLRSIQSGLLSRRRDGLPSTTEKKKNLNTADLFILGRALDFDAPIRISLILKEMRNPRTLFLAQVTMGL